MTYYGEWDRKAAAWIRELMRRGLVTEGAVDERSIVDLRAAELCGYRRVHLFAGIGGWELALRLAGWPADREVWTGSCPCQPFSAAGQRRGTADERHLWPAMRGLVAEFRPAAIFGEQVASPLGRAWLARVRADLEALGYAVGAADLCAASVGTPHIRQRLFWVAYAVHAELGRRTEPNDQSKSGVHAADGSEVERVAYAEHRRCDGAKLPIRRRRQEPAASDDARSTDRLANADARRCAGREEHDSRRCEIDGTGGTNGLGDADGAGREGIAGESVCGSEQRERARAEDSGVPDPAGFWDRYAIVECRDGKSRRFEPGSFPLVDGFPGRVGLLRGYGNAIVPQVAAEFILACEEAREK